MQSTISNQQPPVDTSAGSVRTTWKPVVGDYRSWRKPAVFKPVRQVQILHDLILRLGVSPAGGSLAPVGVKEPVGVSPSFNEVERMFVYVPYQVYNQLVDVFVRQGRDIVTGSREDMYMQVQDFNRTHFYNAQIALGEDFGHYLCIIKTGGILREAFKDTLLYAHTGGSRWRLYDMYYEKGKAYNWRVVSSIER